jgi:hypothetical protein
MIRPSRSLAVALAGIVLFLGAALSASAGDRPIGDWKWNVDDPELYSAGIELPGGHVLAQFCIPNKGSCFYAVGFGITCEPNEKYHVLVNSDVGSSQLEFVCGDSIGKQNVLLAADFDALDSVVRDANRVGFAIPMANDEFKAVRFSLRGSNEAIDAMREAAQTAPHFRTAVSEQPVSERF